MPNIFSRSGFMPLAARSGRRCGTVLMQTKTVTSASSSGDSALVWAEGLTKTWDGIKYQFKGIDLVLTRGERAGLVGANGCGKSTLLRVLAGKDEPDAGQVQLRKGMVTAYVEQEPDFPAGSTLGTQFPCFTGTIVLKKVLNFSLYWFKSTQQYTNIDAKGAAAML